MIGALRALHVRQQIVPSIRGRGSLTRIPGTRTPNDSGDILEAQEPRLIWRAWGAYEQIILNLWTILQYGVGYRDNAFSRLYFVRRWY